MHRTEPSKRQPPRPLEVAPLEPFPHHLLPRLRADLRDLEALEGRLWGHLSGREVNVDNEPDVSLLRAYGYTAKARIYLERATREAERKVSQQGPAARVVVS